jgi:PilZ domain-containing protein
MAQQFPRKHHRLKTFATLKYNGYKLAGRGIVKDLSQSGSCITGNVPVRAGMVLSLQIFVPGVLEPLQIDRATVVWVKRAEFGVHFDGPTIEVTKQITQVIYEQIKKQRESSPV